MNSTTMNRIVWMLCFFFLFQTANVVGQTTTQKNDSLKTATIKVSGITCGMDLKIINGNIQKLNGVESSESISKASPTTTFQVKYNPSVITIDSIYKVVENSPSCDFPDQKPYRVKKGK